ncbi:unnamed protein product [Rhizophagus irregularis]|nr:unnamed protein product [Rhizophagus irregularis]
MWLVKYIATIFVENLYIRVRVHHHFCPNGCNTAKSLFVYKISYLLKLKLVKCFSSLSFAYFLYQYFRSVPYY